MLGAELVGAAQSSSRKHNWAGAGLGELGSSSHWNFMTPDSRVENIEKHPVSRHSGPALHTL